MLPDASATSKRTDLGFILYIALSPEKMHNKQDDYAGLESIV
jgi:hypothetical protein